LGLRLAMIEQPDLFSKEQLSAVSLAISKKWQHDPDNGNGWSTFNSVDADLADVESRGLLTPVALEKMRAFFDNRRCEIEAGRY